MLCVGVDIGLSGALALYAADTGAVSVWDMPTVKQRVGRTIRPRIDDEALLALARLLCACGLAAVGIEAPIGKKNQSSAKALVSGSGHGRVWMAFVACGVTPISVHPATWKTALRLRGDKEVARDAATRLLPLGAKHWPQESDHNRAEAGLIALYVSRATAARGVADVV